MTTRYFGLLFLSALLLPSCVESSEISFFDDDGGLDGSTLDANDSRALEQQSSWESNKGPDQVTRGYCGNGVVEANEQCDGNEPNDMTCVDLAYGFVGGTIRCDQDTCTYDISDCRFSETCGNGVVEPGEQCDGSDLSGATCLSVGFSSGTLLCSAACTYNTLECSADSTSMGCFRGIDPKKCVATPDSGI